MVFRLRPRLTPFPRLLYRERRPAHVHIGSFPPLLLRHGPVSPPWFSHFPSRLRFPRISRLVEQPLGRLLQTPISIGYV